MRKVAPALLATLLAASPVPAAPPAMAPPPVSGSEPVRVDRKYMLGLWTDDGDCSNAVEFTEDGRFVSSGGLEGLWRLDGDRLTMSGNGSIVLRIVPVDRDTMTVINGDGSLGRSTRCAAPAAAEAS